MDSQEKTSLTAAAQQLTGELPNIKTVLGTDPNIITFGTIRPSKGFDEALDLAQEIYNSQKKFTDNNLGIPIVIIMGDPQEDNIMIKLFQERYGEYTITQYIKSNQPPTDSKEICISYG